MDTQNLRAFVAVAEKKSFSYAAESLHITQPAVSKRIATLESQLECKLFDRIGRTVQLTEAGNALLPRAEQILQSVQEAKRSIADASSLSASWHSNVRGTHTHNTLRKPIMSDVSTTAVVVAPRAFGATNSVCFMFTPLLLPESSN